MDNSIVPVHLAVKAMRDNGYKNAAYAIAELIDNSIQHGATRVDLLCSEIDTALKLRNVPRINQIAVLDNGCGMDKNVLRMALQFGNGTHLEKSHQSGIGKFGMGLPSSSISQAKKVEVWSWKNDINNAIYTYLDLDKIVAGELKFVPEPIEKNIPPLWLKAGKSFGKSGTLVLWSNLDRCIWKTASAIIENSEFLIGRMYRNFIIHNKVEINMISFNQNNPDVYTKNQKAKPNDPIYLMHKTSTPAPFSEIPMFEKWGGDSYEISIDIIHNGEKHTVKTRFSIAKKEAREGTMAGSRPHGKHAGKNIGISILRAGRELDMDQAWVIQYDPRERWWGVEVEFPPALDEIFGVTNNKQFANNFSELGKVDFDQLTNEGKSFSTLRDELEEEGDPKALLIDIASRIKSQVNIMRSVIKAQTKNEKRENQTRHEIITPEKIATEATEERRDQGHSGTSDIQEINSVESNKAEIIKSLEDDGIQNAHERAEFLIKNNLKYSFVDTEFESFAFFSVKSKGGKILISLNINHPAYEKLIEVLDETTENTSKEELETRLKNASDGLKLLLMAWARYEDEQPDGRYKTLAQQVRFDWGKIARDFLHEE
jgi:hypothetical protein